MLCVGDFDDDKLGGFVLEVLNICSSSTSRLALNRPAFARPLAFSP